MRKAALLAYQVREPYALAIKVVTEFEPLKSGVEPEPAFILARLFLYSKTAVYRGQIRKGDINSQLTWSDSSLTTLVDSLSGLRKNIDIRFSELNGSFSLICEIESGIRITMFEIMLD
jgi:hypothetical protein